MSGLGLDVFGDRVDEALDSKVLDLFREHTVVEVKDIKLELSNKIEKSHRRFTQELQEHFRDILTVTNEVGELYRFLKDGDSLFMDLCFKDNVYGVDKLPELHHEPIATNLRRKSTTVTCLAPMSPVVSSATSVLLVSNWTLAITDFVSRFTASSNPGKLFDKTLQEFENLRNHIAQLHPFKKIILSKCHQFLSFINDDEASHNIFTFNQWAKLYNLILRDEPPVFEWDSEQLKAFDSLLFDTTLANYTEDLLKDEQVQEFVRSAIFQSKMSEKILKSIHVQLMELDDLLKSGHDVSRSLSHLHKLASRDTTASDIVDESRLYAEGLVTDQRVALYRLITSITDKLRSLKVNSGGSNQMADLKSRLIEKLQQCLPSELPGSTATLKMDDMISDVMRRHNDENYRIFIERQIKRLRE
ncbi:hypothetical protein HG535_0B02650 [Zygotorulaspora mrakii]|uniref:Uncharacterized protein n=1 Tax=Zygotorulaspora mrakii TaxID=42260 RepID=A0A7H9AYA2_ZYGMR|nr:uncharacterized protein HG535_0B02650 [Zygotorulaspora mrakii]QLG71226.1 hypothetical protein HG535_0B02650 [Zygotorulaspora mrakii]